MPYPKLTLLPGQDRRLRAGHPWVFSNELQMDAAAKALAPGEVVCLATSDGRQLALAQFNPHSLIAARVLTRNKDAAIDANFLERRLVRALRLREKLFDQPYHRLVHAEADGLPGLVIDRFADVLVCQLNSAGMARLEEPLLEALQRVLRPRAVVLRNDSPVRELEGLEVEVRLAKGEPRGRSSWSRTGSPSSPTRWAVRRPAGTSTSRRTARSRRGSRAVAGCSTCTATAAGSALRLPPQGPERCWRSTGRRPASIWPWRVLSATACPAC